MTNDTPSLYLDGVALNFNLDPFAHFGGHTEITLQDVPKLEYSLRLSVGNEKAKLQTKDNRTWTLAQRPYVLCFS